MFQGKAIIFSAPSGSGKSTIISELSKKIPQLGFSISACTRQPRPNEKHGVHYYFLSVKDFEEKIQQGALIEYEQVYPGKYYGTLKEEVERLWAQKQHVLFDVDVQGGKRLKEYFGPKALGIFVKVPSMQVLEQRLAKRATETPQSLKERLEKAQYEMTFEPSFDKSLLNDNLAHATSQAEQWVKQFINFEPIQHSQS